MRCLIEAAAILLTAPLALAASAAEEDPSLERAYSRRVFTREDGLPSDKIRDVLQTRDGYLWVATEAGLSRYDGWRFVVFNPANTPVMGQADCTRLAEDEDGAVWVVAGDRLLRIKEQFEWVATLGGSARGSPERPEVVKSPGFALSLAMGGGVWIVDGGDIRRWQDGVFSDYRIDWHGFGETVSRRCAVEVVDSPGSGVWAATTYGPGRLDTSRGVFDVDHEAATNRISQFCMGVAVGADGNWWALIGRESHPQEALLTRYSHGRWEPVADRSLSNGSRRLHLLADIDGSVWVPVDKAGLLRWRDGGWARLPLLPEGRRDYATSLIQDMDGNLWAGTESAGLILFRRRGVEVVGLEDGLPDPDVRAILSGRDGTLWLGTDAGLVRYRDGALGLVSRGTEGGEPEVRALLEDHEGRLWVGTRSGLFWVQADQWHEVALPGEWYRAKVRGLAEDHQGRLWVSAAGGLSCLQGDRLVASWSGASLGVRDLTGITADGRGRIWVGTDDGGLVVIEGGLRRSLTVSDGLLNDQVNALYSDDEGLVWVATSGGLNLVAGGEVRSVPPIRGLTEGDVNQVIGDREGWLWFCTDRGVVQVSRAGLLALVRDGGKMVEPIAYGLEEGLPVLETHGVISQPSACVAADGRVWIGTARGAVALDPARLPESASGPVPVIEELRANGLRFFSNLPVEDRGIAETRDFPGEGDRWVFPPGTARNLSISWTAPRPVSAADIQFTYRLDGVDDHWVEAETRRRAFYSNLRPGKYAFQLRARDKHGKESGLALPVEFVIRPYLVETGWFQGGLAVLALAGLGGGYAWRERHLRRIHRLEQETATLRERERLARDLHDGVAGSLARVAMLADWKDLVGLPASDPRIERPSQSTREALQTLRDAIWSTHPVHDTLTSLVGRIQHHAYETLRAAGVSCRFHVPEDLPEEPLSVDLRTGLYFAVKEAVHNVIRHAQASEVRLGVARHNGLISITVEDNGRGFDPEAAMVPAAPGQDGGQGLRNIRDRIEGLHGRVEIESHSGRGTRVCLSVPVDGNGRA